MVLITARHIVGRKKEICFDGSIGTPHIVALDNTLHNKNVITRKAVTPSTTRRTNHITGAPSPDDAKGHANPRITLRDQGRHPEMGPTPLGHAETRPTKDIAKR